MNAETPWYVSNFAGDEYLARYAHRSEAEARSAVRALAPALRLDRTDGSGAPGHPPRGASATVVDLACGAGRHVRPLLEAGATRVIGVDLSASLLAHARQALAPELAARTVELLEADMRALPLPGASARAVVSFFTSFGYFADQDDDRRVLTEVRRVLAPGGRYLLDFLNAHLARQELVPHEREVMPGGETREVWRSYDPDTRRLEKRELLTAGDGRQREYRESVRAYTRMELVALAEAAGLEMVTTYGDYEGRAYTIEAPRAILIAERPAGLP